MSLFSLVFILNKMISDFAKEKVFWTKKMNLRLVKFIETKPNIWNPKHPKYTSVEYRDRTYAEFASKYGDEFTGQAVKDRWTNIRSTFANYLRKLNASRAKGDGEEYKVNWHLWDSCKFLLKVNRKGQTDPTSSDNCMEINIKEDSQNEGWNSEEDNQANPIDNDLCKTVANNLVNIFERVQSDAFIVDDSNYGRVGQAVSRKLSQMNSFDAAKVSQEIMGILLLYDKDNPENPNNSVTIEYMKMEN